jgi:hypothetical protein
MKGGKRGRERRAALLYFILEYSPDRPVGGLFSMKYESVLLIGQSDPHLAQAGEYIHRHQDEFEREAPICLIQRKGGSFSKLKSS